MLLKLGLYLAISFTHGHLVSQSLLERNMCVLRMDKYSYGMFVCSYGMFVFSGMFVACSLWNKTKGKTSGVRYLLFGDNTDYDRFYRSLWSDKKWFLSNR